MDYPHGHRHNSHHTHHGSDRRDDDREYPPPPFGFNDPPPPQVYHSSHSGPTSDAYHAPPPPNIPSYAPPPPAGVEHHRHFPHFGPSSDAYDAPPPPNIPNYGPPPPSADHRHHFPHGRPSSDARYDPPPPAMENPNRYPRFPSRADQPHAEAEWAKKPSVRMYSKAERDFSLTIREGKVILARSNPSDPLQHWVKDERYSIRVKDEEGFPSFALVNKATGQAMKHAVGANQPVQLIPYNPDILDESILWTESKDLGDGYRAIRMVNNIRLNVDAFNGDKNHGGVHDGTTIVLWEWKKGDNQRWKIVPH